MRNAFAAAVAALMTTAPVSAATVLFEQVGTIQPGGRATAQAAPGTGQLGLSAGEERDLLFEIEVDQALDRAEVEVQGSFFRWMLNPQGPTPPFPPILARDTIINYATPGRPLLLRVTNFFGPDQAEIGRTYQTFSLAIFLADASSTTSVTNYTFRITDVTAIPEPATWALMIAGFGFVGAASRRRWSPAKALT